MALLREQFRVIFVSFHKLKGIECLIIIFFVLLSLESQDVYLSFSPSIPLCYHARQQNFRNVECPIFRQRGHACQTPRVQIWPALPHGWVQTDRRWGSRQKDGPGEEICRYANEALAVSDRTLGGQLCKAQGREGGFFSSTGRLHFPHQWKLDTVICHWVPGLGRIS